MVTLSGREGTFSPDDMASSSSASQPEEMAEQLGDVSRERVKDEGGEGAKGRCDLRPTIALFQKTKLLAPRSRLVLLNEATIHDEDPLARGQSRKKKEG